MFDEAARSDWIMNPIATGNQQQEDFIGKSLEVGLLLPAEAFNLLLERVARDDGLAAAANLYMEAAEGGISPTVETFNSMMQAAAAWRYTLGLC
ncbi:hypothetical protein AK812_SmicGene31786 [Symbiodinium microadriaticum]|uniref:Uncharacterized protein n=1 Tax=Symbiodinium microadriaticum TaxID=2951 RepID=A0A1Q9CVX2_SYMMI|nr:hypothetical protein AK812_SmicGene31786 [Symbiodinium microadriaticum]